MSENSKAVKTVEIDRAKEAAKVAREAEVLASRPVYCPPAKPIFQKPEFIIRNPGVRVWDVAQEKQNPNKPQAPQHPQANRFYVTWPEGKKDFGDQLSAMVWAREIMDEWLTKDQAVPNEEKPYLRELPEYRSTLVRVWCPKLKVKRNGETEYLGHRPHYPDGVAAPTSEGVERNVRISKKEKDDAPIIPIKWLVMFDNGTRREVERLRPTSGGEKFFDDIRRQGEDLVLNYHVGEANEAGEVNCTCVRAICPIGEEMIDIRREEVLPKTIVEPEERKRVHNQVLKLSAGAKTAFFTMVKRQRFIQ